MRGCICVSFNVPCLIQVNVGREWYLHAIYTVHAKDKRVRRHVVLSRDSSSRNKRAAIPAEAEQEEIVDEIGRKHNRGTQMMHLKLNRNYNAAPGGGAGAADRSSSTGGGASSSGGGVAKAGSAAWTAIVLGAVFVVAAGGLLAFVLMRRRRRRQRGAWPTPGLLSVRCGSSGTSVLGVGPLR